MSYSSQLWKKALQCLVGGVNSPVRAFTEVGDEPVLFSHGQGAYLFDVDGNPYIDYVGSWGAAILGHAHTAVTQAIQKAVMQGLSFGAPSLPEIRLAEKIKFLMPSLEKLRFVNSGTEATMAAIRLARGFTGRPKIIKFNGCYHGAIDSLLVESGSGVSTLGLSNNPSGIPSDFTQHTLTAEFNNLDQIVQLFQYHGQTIAAIIVEPVVGNSNCILPQPNFLSGLRELCDQYGSLLIFDEVITGFRVALGGAQTYYGIRPDLTTLGKIIGGGMPVGALGGRHDIMEWLAPSGPVYQAGTLSGNPIAMTAGLATLTEMARPGVYNSLISVTQSLCQGLEAQAKENKIPLKTAFIGGLFGLLFTDQTSIYTPKQVKAASHKQFKQFFQGMLARGIYLTPSLFEAGFVSIAHTQEDIQRTLVASEKVFKAMKASLTSTPDTI